VSTRVAVVWHLKVFLLDVHFDSKYIASMTIRSALVLALYGLSCVASAAAVPGDSFSLVASREEADPNAIHALRKRGAALPAKLGKSLYWFIYAAVGDSGSKRLLLDTGSTDLILNNNQWGLRPSTLWESGLTIGCRYTPSSHKKPYGTGNFSITYEVSVDEVDATVPQTQKR
jgi:hypothetical protein